MRPATLIFSSSLADLRTIKSNRLQQFEDLFLYRIDLPHAIEALEQTGVGIVTGQRRPYIISLEQMAQKKAFELLGNSEPASLEPAVVKELEKILKSAENAHGL